MANLRWPKNVVGSCILQILMHIYIYVCVCVLTYYISPHLWQDLRARNPNDHFAHESSELLSHFVSREKSPP